jgi:hypothetical protein
VPTWRVLEGGLLSVLLLDVEHSNVTSKRGWSGIICGAY